MFNFVGASISRKEFIFKIQIGCRDFLFLRILHFQRRIIAFSMYLKKKCLRLSCCCCLLSNAFPAGKKKEQQENVDWMVSRGARESNCVKPYTVTRSSLTTSQLDIFFFPSLNGAVNELSTR
jgi:hypothetical protein